MRKLVTKYIAAFVRLIEISSRSCSQWSHQWVTCFRSLHQAAVAHHEIVARFWILWRLLLNEGARIFQGCSHIDTPLQELLLLLLSTCPMASKHLGCLIERRAFVEVDRHNFLLLLKQTRSICTRFNALNTCTTQVHCLFDSLLPIHWVFVKNLLCMLDVAFLEILAVLIGVIALVQARLARTYICCNTIPPRRHYWNFYLRSLSLPNAIELRLIDSITSLARLHILKLEMELTERWWACLFFEPWWARLLGIERVLLLYIMRQLVSHQQVLRLGQLRCLQWVGWDAHARHLLLETHGWRLLGFGIPPIPNRCSFLRLLHQLLVVFHRADEWTGNGLIHVATDVTNLGELGCFDLILFEAWTWVVI